MPLPWYRGIHFWFANSIREFDPKWDVVDIGEREVTMSLDSFNVRPEFEQKYPYPFDAKIRIEIDDDGNMIYNFSIKNTGGEDLPICLGLRPNFAKVHEDTNRIKFKGLTGSDREKADWDRDPTYFWQGVYPKGVLSSPYEGGIIASMPSREISIEDVTAQGPQARYWRVWPEQSGLPEDSFSVQPMIHKEDYVKDSTKVAPGETWNWTMKFSASFNK
jgi:galactose mutarotase-like enzyme